MTGAIDGIHGYTLDDMYALARTAVSAGLSRWPAGNRADQVSVAWEAIAEHLCAAPCPPRRSELIEVAKTAVAREVKAQMRHHGTRRDGTNTGASFARYWDWHSRAAASPEEPVCERLALAQIWVTLTPRQQSALLALAAFGHYPPAITALGIQRVSFMKLIGAARTRFRGHWHEGEIPSRHWGHDRRVAAYDCDDPGELAARAVTAARARQRRAAARHDAGLAGPN